MEEDAPGAAEPSPTPSSTATRSWVSGWMRDESFWRDVASNTIAGLIIAIVVAIAAAALGFLPARFLWVMLAVIAVGGLSVALALWLDRVQARYRAVGDLRTAHRILVLRLIFFGLWVVAAFIWLSIGVGLDYTG